jgi:hypothetical protein
MEKNQTSERSKEKQQTRRRPKTILERCINLFPDGKMWIFWVMFAITKRAEALLKDRRREWASDNTSGDSIPGKFAEWSRKVRCSTRVPFRRGYPQEWSLFEDLSVND